MLKRSYLLTIASLALASPAEPHHAEYLSTENRDGRDRHQFNSSRDSGSTLSGSLPSRRSARRAAKYPHMP